MPVEGDLAQRLITMRESLEAQADEKAQAELDDARDAQAKAVTLEVPAGEFDSWVELAAGADAGA